MKKIRRIITMLLAGALAITFISCDAMENMTNSLQGDFAKWWGDPQAEGNELKCGIPNTVIVSGKLTYNKIDCGYIELDPNIGLRGQFTSYIEENGTPVYQGQFFYNESTSELWIYVERVWVIKDNKWTSAGAGTNLTYYGDNKPYFKAENVDLTTQDTPVIDATKQVTYEQYNTAYEEMTDYIKQKHSGSSDTTGITEDNIFDPEEREDRFRFIEAFNNALNNHDPSSTTVEYKKVKNVFTYVAEIDGNTLELMIFSDKELFFYPYDDNDRTYMLGMFLYNQASYYDDEGKLDYTRNKGARKWIRETYRNIGDLYDELYKKAETAKTEAKKKAEADYEASKK